MRFGDLAEAFPRAIPLGFVPAGAEANEPVLNPPADATVRPGDRLVFLARAFVDTAPQPRFEPQELQPDGAAGPPSRPRLGDHRVLVLGWNHKIPALIGVLSTYEGKRFRVDVLSTLPAADRLTQLSRLGIEPGDVELAMFEGDFAVPTDLLAVDPFGHDNIVFAASDRLETGAESDARTLTGHLLVDSLRGGERHTEILVELLDPENAQLIGADSEHLVSTKLISHMLAQVSLRPELRAVYDELVGPGSAEIVFNPAERYDLCDRPVNFTEIQETIASRGEIALGLRLEGERSTTPGGGFHLNPERDRSWTLTVRDEVVALTTY